MERQKNLQRQKRLFERESHKAKTPFRLINEQIPFVCTIGMSCVGRTERHRVSDFDRESMITVFLLFVFVDKREIHTGTQTALHNIYTQRT